MNSQEKKIVVAGVVISVLSSAGISMVQGDFNNIDDNYQSPSIVAEETIASNDSNSINLVKTDADVVDKNNEEETEEIEKIKTENEFNEDVKQQVSTTSKTFNSQKNTSSQQTKPEQKPTKTEEKPIEHQKYQRKNQEPKSQEVS